MTQLIESDPRRQITADEVKDQVRLIQKVMQGVMKKDTHYGVIPGCKQPSLYKAGSEVLLTTFRLGLRLRIEDLSTPDCVRYRVIAEGYHQATQTVMGEGVGECSSNEDKYKWRKAVCDEEFDATPESMRRIKFAKGQGGSAYKTKQVRTDPADQANTVLKMAKKRAQIDFTLTALSASDIFTQDIEDYPESYFEEAQTITPVGEPELKRLRELLAQYGGDEAQFCKVCKVEKLEDLPLKKFADAESMLMAKIKQKEPK